MNSKEIIAAVLVTAGIILGLGAVGTLDFLGEAATKPEIIREIIKSIIAGGLMFSAVALAKSTNKEGEDDE